MVQILTIKCVRGRCLEEPFERTVEVPDGFTLGELHGVIQSLTGFDNDHMFTFFTGRTHHGRRVELVDAEDGEDAMGGLYERPVSGVFPLSKGRKLFYWFDFGDDWMFQITRRTNSRQMEKGMKYPRVIKEAGPRPEQYPGLEE
ncbi:MAG: hypothetical protein HY812_11455 [Planctomycetes bacterium]|nr:hypothetical protein [Planctomycetota bacterium]